MFISRLTPRAADRLTIIFLILLPPVFFWRETLGWLTLGDQDARFWFFPIYKLVAEQIRAGHLPLWNPYMYSGTPLFSQMQAGVLDPINWIYLFGTTARTLTLAQETSFVIALLSAWSYARRLGWKRRAGVVTAVIYAFSGFAVGRTIYPGLLHIFALTPLPLCFIERIYQSRMKETDEGWRAVLGGGLIVAWQIFAGHPQPFVYSSLLAASYALFCAFLRKAEEQVKQNPDPETEPEISRRKPERQKSKFPSLHFLAQCALMYLAGVGLAAVQLLPAVEFAGQSVRREWTYEMFTAYSLHPLSLFTILFPFFHGGGNGIYQMPFRGNYWHHNEAQIYLGAMAVSLAVAGLISSWRNQFRVGVYWGVVAAFAGLLSLGRYVSPLAQAIYHLPLLNSFRSPNRHWMEVTLAVAVLGGYATNLLLCDRELANQPEKKANPAGRHAAIIAGALSLLCFSTGWLVLSRSDLAGEIVRSLTRPGTLPTDFFHQAQAEFYLPMMTTVGAFLLLLFVARPRRPPPWYPLLLIFLLIDFNLYAAFAPVNSSQKPEAFIGLAVPQEIRAGRSENERWRYHVLLDGASGDFSPDAFYGSEMMTGYDPLINARYKIFSGIDEAGHSYLTSPLDARDQTLDLLSVRYLMVAPARTEAQSDWRVKKIRHELSDSTRWRRLSDRSEMPGWRDFEVYENLRALPRAWLAGEVVPVFEGDQLKTIRGEMSLSGSRAFDPRKVALIEPEEFSKLSAALQSAAVNVSDESEAAGRMIRTEWNGAASVTVEVTASRPAMLMLNEIAVPGWRAKLDGAETKLWRVNYTLCGLEIPAGIHKVEMFFQPRSLLTGAIISAMTLLTILMMLARKTRTLRLGA